MSVRVCVDDKISWTGKNISSLYDGKYGKDFLLYFLLWDMIYYWTLSFIGSISNKSYPGTILSQHKTLHILQNIIFDRSNIYNFKDVWGIFKNII